MSELKFESWYNDGQEGVAVYVNGSRAFNLKSDGGRMIGIDFGQPFTSDNFRQIASKLDELNGTTQPSLLERVRDLRDALRRDKDRWDVAWLHQQNAGRDSCREGGGIDALTEALRVFDCVFPELKDLSAGEQG